MAKVKTTSQSAKPDEDEDSVDLSFVLEDLTRKRSPARYPDFETGQIKSHGWVHVPISMVVQLRSEKANPRIEGHLPFVGMDDIETDGLTIAQTRPFAEMKSLGNRFHAGDMLYGRLRPYLNKTATTDYEGACSGELLVLAPTAAIDIRYLQYFMHSRRYVGWVSAVVSGDRPRVGFETLASFAIPLAPIAEQRRIVARVDALFAEIAEGEAALAEARKGLDTFRRALLKAAVTGELTRDWRAANPVTETGHELLVRIAAGNGSQAVTKRRGRRSANAKPLDTSNLPSLPEGWAWGRLSALGNFGRGKSRHRPRDDARLYGGSMPFVQTGVVANSDDFIRAFQQTYSELGVEQSRVWPPGTVCITIAANIAKTAITTFDCCFPDSIVGLTPVPAINPYWVHIWISTIQRRLERFAPATAQKNINLEVLDAVLVPVPPPAEATEVLRRVSLALNAAADSRAMLEAEVADAARLKQSILKAAFEGCLVPQDHADEPASELLARVVSNVPVMRAKPGRTRKSKA